MMMPHWRPVSLIVAMAAAAPALLGCDAVKLDPQADQAAKAAYTHLWRGEDAALEAMMAPEARSPRDAALFARIRRLIPPGPPKSEKTLSWNNYMGTGGRRVTLQQQYDYGGSVVSATIVLKAGGPTSGWWVQGLNVNVSLDDMSDADLGSDGAASASDTATHQPL